MLPTSGLRGLQRDINRHPELQTTPYPAIIPAKSGDILDIRLGKNSWSRRANRPCWVSSVNTSQLFSLGCSGAWSNQAQTHSGCTAMQELTPQYSNLSAIIPGRFENRNTAV